MSDPAAARRFVCRSCGHVHATWAARCSRCRSLEGLTVELMVEVPLSSIPPMQSIPQQEAPPEPSRPRLMIARAAPPEPELEDPVEELADVLDEEELVPLSRRKSRSVPRRVSRLSITFSEVVSSWPPWCYSRRRQASARPA